MKIYVLEEFNPGCPCCEDDLGYTSIEAVVTDLAKANAWVARDRSTRECREFELDKMP